jgi:hypothetical protein
MKFLLDYDFTEEEIANFSENVPPVLLECILNSYKLVSTNIDFLKKLGVHNYKEIFTKFYDMFLMDYSNFASIFNKYDHDDLVLKIEQNADIVEFL